MSQQKPIDNSEIDQILKQATKYAEKFQQRYVTVDHLTLALLSYKSFYNLVGSTGVDIDNLIIKI